MHAMINVMVTVPYRKSLSLETRNINIKGHTYTDSEGTTHLALAFPFFLLSPETLPTASTTSTASSISSLPSFITVNPGINLTPSVTPFIRDLYPVGVVHML